ncbi:unnamed protein product, partial [Sphacelaria rigidula]
FRDVVWLNGDRLVLVARQGFISLVSPGDVLTEWDVRGIADEDPPDQPEVGVKPATHQRNPADPLTLNVVAAHEGGFFVGGSRGRVLVFQQGFHGDGAGGAGDVYTLTRVIKLFDGVADVVELRPGEGTGYRWLAVSADDGEIGLLDTLQLTLSSSSPGGSSVPRLQLLARRLSSLIGLCVEMCGVASHLEGTAASQISGATAEIQPGGEAIVRGFARAMDKFELSLLKTSASSESDVGSTRGKEPMTARMSDSKSKRDRVGGGKFFTEDQMRGGERYTNRREASGGGGGGGGGRPSMSCLSLCARKPLLAGITRIPGDSAVNSDGVVGGNGVDEDTDVSAKAGSGAERPSLLHRNPASPPLGGGIGGRSAVKLQVWNYRTKRLLVSHRFEQGGASSAIIDETDDDDDGGAGEENKGSTAAAENKDGCSDAGADEDGGSNNADLTPVALSLHPSGDSIAVAFPHYVSMYYIVGGGSVEASKEGIFSGGGGGGGSVPHAGHPSALAAVCTGALGGRFSSGAGGAGGAGAAVNSTSLMLTLRSDQREFLTKGMFTVVGETDPVINYDPVSAVHYSPGGHLLAIVTGKV